MLEAENLTASYADYTALEGLTCRVESGQTVASVGPNGAGKSTFMRLAAGLLEPSGGRVTIGGYTAGSWRPGPSCPTCPTRPPSTTT